MSASWSVETSDNWAWGKEKEKKRQKEKKISALYDRYFSTKELTIWIWTFCTTRFEHPETIPSQGSLLRGGKQGSWNSIGERRLWDRPPKTVSRRLSNLHWISCLNRPRCRHVNNRTVDHATQQARHVLAVDQLRIWSLRRASCDLKFRGPSFGFKVLDPAADLKSYPAADLKSSFCSPFAAFPLVHRLTEVQCPPIIS